MLDCLIIGAGPAGIVCTKELLENGVDNIVCLDQASDMGGTFRKSYDSLTLTTSAVMSMFSDFWIGDDQTMAVWGKSEAVDYWLRYADHFNVTDKLRFGQRVSSVRPAADSAWRVQTDSGEEFVTKRVVVASGNNNVPRYPDWRMRVASPEVQVFHSHNYKNADSLRGKRVLIVGGGESGTDIALEVSKVAEQCWISLRCSTGWLTPRKRGTTPADIATHRGVWGLPRSYGPDFTRGLIRVEIGRNTPVSDAAAMLNKKVANRLGVFGTYGTKTFSLPVAIAEFGCKLVGEITGLEEDGRRLSTSEGESIEDVDAIVFCTGFTNRIDFLPEELRETNPRDLYKHMFHPDLGLRLCWLGRARANFGSQFPIMELQARYFAQLCKGACRLPERSVLNDNIQRDRLQFENQFEKHAISIPSLVDYPAYADGMARLLGATPPYWSYFFFRNKVWRRIVYGALQGTQFRLKGLGSKPKLARDILKKCPSLKLSDKRARLGYIGRITCAWRWIAGYGPRFLLRKADRSGAH
jgi:dimethylaniline monooxygenase (N-oxide forming)